jgi:23S rRNA pseudouridine2605 synthase
VAGERGAPGARQVPAERSAPRERRRTAERSDTAERRRPSARQGRGDRPRTAAGRGPDGRSERRPAAEGAGAGGATTAESEGLRINKVLSAAGLGSRRAVEELVRAGRVAINGEVVRELGRRVDPASDRVEVDGSRVVVDQRLRYWMLNKPLGVVSTADDPQGRPTVVEMVPEEPRVYPVGRLDRDSEGLVLLTNDGELANRVTHPRYRVEKRYLAEVERLPASTVARVQRGVELEDGLARAERARVVAGSGRRRMIEVVMVEGRKREVRRMLEEAGAPVRRLVRTAIGPLRLSGLAPGEYRALRPEEVRSLYRAAGL